MTDAILMRDLPLSWDCPACGAPAARHEYPHTMQEARCKPDCPNRPRRPFLGRKR